MHSRSGVLIRVALADDSAILRKALRAILSMFPGMEIVGVRPEMAWKRFSLLKLSHLTF
jgi:DNA-binding NarL/FixJ family response regulator